MISKPLATWAALSLSLSAMASAPQRYFLDLGGGEGIDSLLHWSLGSPVKVLMNDLNAGACVSVSGAGDHRTNKGMANSSVTVPATHCGLTVAQVRYALGLSITKWTGSLPIQSGVDGSGARTDWGSFVGIALAKLDLQSIGALPSGFPTASPYDSNDNYPTAITTAPYSSTNRCEGNNSDPDLDSGDGFNNLLFTSKRQTNCSLDFVAEGIAGGTIGLTRVRYNPQTGEIAEADIQFDDTNFDFVLTSNNLASNPEQINLLDVATHEFGHFFGLDHSNFRRSSMLFAIADDLQRPKNEDKNGLYSIYPAVSATGTLGTLRGSVTASDGSAIFGAAVYLLNARTLETDAVVLSDLNGAFEFCSVPAGPHIIFANRYKPYGSNIGRYFSGDGRNGIGVASDGTCYNVGCTVMNRSMTYSWESKTPTSGSGGIAMKIVNVAAGTTTQYVNLVALTTEASLSVIGSTGTGSAITFEEPRLARLSSGTVNATVSGIAVGTNRFSFTAPGSSTVNVRIRTSSLGIGARLNLTLAVLHKNGGTETAITARAPGAGAVDVGSGCAIAGLGESTVLLQAHDPWLECTLTSGQLYVVDVSGVSYRCRDVPGNSSSCSTDEASNKAASTNIPYYLFSVYQSSAEATSATPTTESLSTSSLASTRFSNLLTCGVLSATVQDSSVASDGGGCCGSLGKPPGGKGPNGPLSLVLSILLSPLTWFGAWWITRGRRRRRAHV